MTCLALLSDDLLASILSLLEDGNQLRALSTVSKRFASLLRDRGELWSRVHITLLPKLFRGRDRRNSYTTPCRADLGRLAAWLAHRFSHIRELTLDLRYPDALLELPRLLGPLAPGLRALALAGAASREWCYVEADWRWLRSLTNLERLTFEDVLLDLGPLCLPTSLTTLCIDRVGEGGEELSGWDELPQGFSKLTRLRQLTLGTATAYVTHHDDADDAEAVFAPLGALSTLDSLGLPYSPLAAVPSVVKRLPHLTSLDLAGCDPNYHLGGGWRDDAFDSLACATTLRCLNLSDCGLRAVPGAVCTLPELRTLLLGYNQLAAPCPTLLSGSRWVLYNTGDGSGGSSGSNGSGGSNAEGKAAAPVQCTAPYLRKLQHLDLQHSPMLPVPWALVRLCAALTWLDLAGSCPPGSQDWERLAANLPPGCNCRHSCRRLAGGNAAGARAAGAPAAQPGLEYIPAEQQQEAEEEVWGQGLAGLLELVAASQEAGSD